MKAEDDKPGSPPKGEEVPDVAWTEEESRLLSELRDGGGPDATETIRRLVGGILRQARSDLGEGETGGSDSSGR